MNEHERKGPAPSGAGSANAAVQRSAGKTSHTARLASARPVEESSDVPMGALQFSMAGGAATAPVTHDDPFGLHLEGSAAQATAARGVEGSSAQLPHLETIQASFGRHDVGGVAAHVGGRAAEAAGALGAEAYATGNSVAFGSSPSLHTAAHEAAHVVQQRAGVSLKGGVGESGDAYEQHADRVADAVVAGQSAEALLDRGPSGGASAGPAIQKKEVEAYQPGGAKYDPAQDPDVAAAEGDTEGDQLRKAVLASARTRLDQKTEIVSQTAIEDKRAGNVTLKLSLDGEWTVKVPLDTPMKNFTTCIEFAGQTFRDGAKAVGKDAKEDASLARGLPTFMLLFNKETELNLQIAGLQDAIRRLQTPEGEEIPDDPKKQKMGDKAKLQKEKVQGEKAALEAKLESETTNPDGSAKELNATEKARVKGLQQQIGGKDQQLKGIQTSIDAVEKQIKKFRTDIAKHTENQGTIDGINDAWMKPEEQFPGNRPKPGEYVLTGAAGTQEYKVKDAPKGTPAATLVKGQFKHIAVFNGLGEGKDLPTDGTWEEWKTIDGGGVEPVGKSIFVQIDKPYGVQFQAPDPSKPWAGGSNMLLGWIDADKLAAMSRSDEAAAAAGLKKK